MPYKILFTDIDGTLLNSDRDVSEFTISEFARIKNRIPVILVSARMPKQMTYIQEKLGIIDLPLVCYNGGLVITNDNVIHTTEIHPDLIDKLIDYNENISKEKFHISLFHNDEWYVEEYDYWAKREENNTRVSPEIMSNRAASAKWRNENKGAHKITCMGDADIIEAAFQYLGDTTSNELHLYRSKDTYIEIANKSVSKLTGIKQLLETYYGMELKDAIAFGDNYNDTEMIQAVGHGVAVANARDEVKAVANAITLHHKEDGVAHYLKNIFN